MANGTFLTNVFEYLGEPRISWIEKFLIVGGTIIYVISPLDLLPGIILDDIGITGVALAYINWRIKKLEKKSEPAITEKTDKKITGDFFRDK